MKLCPFQRNKVGIGIMIGAALGAAFGAVTGSMGVSLAIGIAWGSLSWPLPVHVKVVN